MTSRNSQGDLPFGKENCELQLLFFFLMEVYMSCVRVRTPTIVAACFSQSSELQVRNGDSRRRVELATDKKGRAKIELGESKVILTMGYVEARW